MSNITLKSVKINTLFSRETVCFTAEVVHDGEVIALADNCGNGGPTRIHPLPGKQIIDDIGESVDALITQMANQKELDKANKKLAKLSLKNIVYGVPNSGQYEGRGFNMTLTDLVIMPGGKKALQNLVDDVKKKLKAGEVILNSNIEDLLK